MWTFFQLVFKCKSCDPPPFKTPIAILLPRNLHKINLFCQSRCDFNTFAFIAQALWGGFTRQWKETPLLLWSIKVWSRTKINKTCLNMVWCFWSGGKVSNGEKEKKNASCLGCSMLMTEAFLRGKRNNKTSIVWIQNTGQSVNSRQPRDVIGPNTNGLRRMWHHRQRPPRLFRTNVLSF